MSINPEFKPLEDFYLDENKALGKSNLPVEAFRDEPGSLLIPNDSPSVPLKEKPGTPSYLESIGHAFSEYNEFMQAGRFVERSAQFSHPANDSVPDDFNPLDYEHLKDYPPEYWDFISGGQTPNEIAARQEYVNQKIHDKEYFANGSWSANLIGGFGGAATSLSTYIPFMTSIKYASIAESMIKGAIQAAPSVALQTLTHEGFVQATEAGGNLHDFALNSLRDSAFGVAFMAGGAGLGAGFRGSQLWNIRKVANYAYEGVDFNHVVDEVNGGVTGEIKATAAPGIALNAAKLDQAQTFADSAMHSGFIFGIPGVQKLAGNSILGSPLVKGLSHRFDTIKGFTDLMASHSIITKKILNGEARPDSAEDILSQVNAASSEFALKYNGHFLEENGIEGGYNVRNATKALKQRALKQQAITKEEFNRSVVTAVLDNQFNQSKSINAAAKLYRAHVDNLYEILRQAKGIEEDIPAVRNAKGYFTLNPDTIAMTKRPEDFRDVVINALTKQDNLLETLLKPLNKARTHLQQLEAHKLSGEGYDRSLVQEIKTARQDVYNEQLILEKRAREDEDVSILLEDRNFLTMDDAEQIRTLHQPINEAKKNLDTHTEQLNENKKKYSAAKSSAKKNLTKEATLRNIEKMKDLERIIKGGEEKLQSLVNIHDDLKFELDRRALNGEIPRKLFIKDGNTVEFRNPEEWAAFRKPYANYEGRKAAAEALRQTYLNNTTEQVQQSILGSIMPSQFANPLGKRTSMIPMKDLHIAGFISTDVPQTVASYSRTLGRHIALDTVFKDVNMNGENGPLGIIKALSEENIKFQKQIEKIPDKAKRQKEYTKLQKDFEDARKFIKQMHSAFMGHSAGTVSELRFIRSLKNYAAATKLGGVPISQLTDLGAIILKHNLWPFLRSGLKPFIQTLNGYMDSELAEDMKANAKHAHLALQHIGTGYSAKYEGTGAVGDIPIGLHLESALEKLAHLSGNLYGTNFIENANQRIVANIMQSQIMEDMYSFKLGNLSKNREIALLQYGLNPKEWADRFINSFEKSKGYKDNLGAYQTRYWTWEDNEAIARMSSTLRRGVYDTVVQRGLFTSPFWTNNPYLSMVMMFHGWGFAAFNKYTVPMLQRAEADKILGIVFMLGLGAMSESLRKFANGRKQEENDDTWFGKSFEIVANSGVLGHTTDMLQTFDKLVDGHLLPARTERYRNWNKWSVLGPVTGISDDLVALYKMGITQNWNKTDFKKGARLVPLEGSIPIRGFINKFFDGLDLPETFGEAKRNRG